METGTPLVPVKLPNGATIYVQPVITRRETDVSALTRDFNINELGATIEGMAEFIVSSLKRVKPKKASIAFGMEIAVESGALTALLVKGSGKADLTVTLEWGEE